MGIGTICFKKKNCNTKEARLQKKLAKEQQRLEKNQKRDQLELIKKVEEEKRFLERMKRKGVFSLSS
jgi:hypothetical protein